MKTTLDIDDSVLRTTGKPSTSLQPCEGLEDNDPFFAALEEIREAGRGPRNGVERGG